jgi:hypothetical protein
VVGGAAPDELKTAGGPAAAAVRLDVTAACAALMRVKALSAVS